MLVKSVWNQTLVLNKISFLFSFFSLHNMINISKESMQTFLAYEKAEKVYSRKKDAQYAETIYTYYIIKLGTY